MAIVNVSVACLSTKWTLFPWNIVSASEPEHSFRDFFYKSIQPHIPSTSELSYDLVHAAVGANKEKMDKVDLDLPVIPVVESFGRFLKYSVNEKGSSAGTSSMTRNAFEVLPASQRSLHGKQLPDSVQERNRKDKLYNDLFHLLGSKKLKLQSSEIHSFGERLVKALRDTLWYVDEAFSRSTALPSVFKTFKDYNNCPEKTKHRKRERQNLSCDQLRHLASELLTLLQANPWERESWCGFKSDIASLDQSLVGYADYLSQKNKAMKLCHVSATPVRELSSNLRLKFIPASTLTLTPTIQESIYTKSNFEYVSITELLPSGPMQKHRTVETLMTAGLRSPCILIIHSSGSNIGNLHFLWKVPCDCDVASVFKQSQAVIESVKAVPHTCYAHSNVRKVRTNFAFHKAFCLALLLQGADRGSICYVHYRARRSGQENQADH